MLNTGVLPEIFAEVVATGHDTKSIALINSSQSGIRNARLLVLSSTFTENSWGILSLASNINVVAPGHFSLIKFFE